MRHQRRFPSAAPFARLLASLRALSRAREGLAAVEFAFIAPIMILLFFGVVEGSAAYSANRKVLLSANTLADLVAQETAITKDNLDDLFVAVARSLNRRKVGGADVALRLEDGARELYGGIGFRVR